MNAPLEIHKKIRNRVSVRGRVPSPRFQAPQKEKKHVPDDGGFTAKVISSIWRKGNATKRPNLDKSPGWSRVSDIEAAEGSRWIEISLRFEWR